MKDIKSGLVKGRRFILRVPKFPADSLLPSWAAPLQWRVLTQRSQLLFCEGQDLNSQLGLMSWSVPKERVPELPRNQLFKVILPLLTVLRLYMSLMVQEDGDAQEVPQPILFQATKRGKNSAEGWHELMVLLFLQCFTFPARFSTRWNVTNAINQHICLPSPFPSHCCHFWATSALHSQTNISKGISKTACVLGG